MGKKYGMLIDLDKCIGCRTCEVACKQEHNLKPRVGEACDFEKTGVPFWIRVDTVGPFGTYPDLTMYYYPSLCRHCEKPPCMLACPNDAIQKRSDGIVLIDAQRCDGALECVAACPYEGVLWHDPQEGWTEKCTFCYERVDRGEEPACVEQCPMRALTFGDMNDPDSEIARRVEAAKEHVLERFDGGSVGYVLRNRQAGHVGNLKG